MFCVTQKKTQDNGKSEGHTSPPGPCLAGLAVPTGLRAAGTGTELVAMGRLQVEGQRERGVVREERGAQDRWGCNGAGGDVMGQAVM